MKSLPIFAPPSAGEEHPRLESEQSLRLAFRTFAESASSLELSYALLRSEVERLRGELAGSRAGLARSLEDNREMRQRLDRILDGLPCGVLVVQGERKISLLNPEGRRLLRSVAATNGRDWNEGPPTCAALTVPHELLELLSRARLGAGEQEQCFSDQAGSDCWLAVRHAEVPEAGKFVPSVGKPKSMEGFMEGEITKSPPVSIFILRDTSEAKRLLLERERGRREQALAEMSAILAHEIRNPLGSLELFAGLLADSGLSDDCREWVGHLQAGLRMLAATVNNVLHFHSLPEPQRVATDMGELLEWAAGFLAPVADQAGVKLRLRNQLGMTFFAAERHRLEQVLQNLVLNAVRALPRGGRVEICGERIRVDDECAIEIRVSDTGAGLAPGQEQKIFEPGFSTHVGSPGLGLTVCRKIVEQHGGCIAAANRADGGACFTMVFPMGPRDERSSRMQETQV